MPSYPYEGYAALSESVGIQLAPYATASLCPKISRSCECLARSAGCMFEATAGLWRSCNFHLSFQPGLEIEEWGPNNVGSLDLGCRVLKLTCRFESANWDGWFSPLIITICTTLTSSG